MPPEVELIEQTLHFVARQPGIIPMIQANNANDPRFSFLFGGPGSDYFQMRLAQLAMPGGQPIFGNAVPAGALPRRPPPALGPPPPAGAPAAAPAVPPAASLPEPLHGELEKLLANLTGSKESIKSSKDWVLANKGHVVEIAARVRAKITEVPEADKRLFLLGGEPKAHLADRIALVDGDEPVRRTLVERASDDPRFDRCLGVQAPDLWRQQPLR
eukprot:tig00000158_g10168.t1